MSNERGFTLIEVLVALAIFSLAALALLRLEGATLANSAALQDHAIAQIVARNVAVETLTDPVAPSLGLSQGAESNAGRQWRWTRRTSLAGQVGLQRIEIGVIDDRGQAIAGLMVFRSAI
jgi:general secretion pathway protein I